MKKIIINVLVILLFGVFVLHQFNISILNLFLSSEEGIKLYCVRFKTSDQTLLDLVNNINDKRDKQQEFLEMDCTNTSIVNLDVSTTSPPSASTVWSLYQDLDYDYPALESFTNFYFRKKIGQDNVNKILKEIYGWVLDPKMDEKTRIRIVRAFENEF